MPQPSTVRHRLPGVRRRSWLAMGGQFVLALLMAASPGFGLLRCPLGEANGSSGPVESSLDWPEFNALDPLTGIRRAHGFLARSSAATGAALAHRCHQTLRLRPELAISGHFLASDLRAPLRC